MLRAKSRALLDWPVDVTDYEIVDIFNWQEQAAGMISQMELDIQTETIERYIREGKLVSYFKSFYEGRRAAGLSAGKKNRVFAKGGYSDKEAERNILSIPFKRFEDIQMLRHTKTLGVVQVEETVRKHLRAKEKDEIGRICDEKLSRYFGRIK